MEYSEGAVPFHYLSTASTNPTSVIARQAKLEGIFVINTTAVLYYLKFYDKASAPTVGTDVPVLTFAIPASASGAGIIVPIPFGVRFLKGIAFALTGAAADADSTNAATGVIIELLAR